MLEANALDATYENDRGRSGAVWTTASADGARYPSITTRPGAGKNCYSAICRSQLMEIGGHRGPDNGFLIYLAMKPRARWLMGADVTKVAPGDDVILT